MRFSLQLLFLALASVMLLCASAAPVDVSDNTSSLADPVFARGNLELTWYAGASMANPACGGSVSSSDYVVALPLSRKKGMCGKRIKITKGSKSVTAKVVDWCEGCNSNHFDLSKAAFKKLASLDQGVVNGASWRVL